MQRTVQDKVPKTQNPSPHDTTPPDNATPGMHHNRTQLLQFSEHSIYPSETTQHVLRLLDAIFVPNRHSSSIQRQQIVPVQRQFSIRIVRVPA